MDPLFLIGEKLNSSRAEARRIFAERDAAGFLALARAQIDGGAAAIDLNAAMLLAGEGAALHWGADLARRELGATVVADSPDTALIVEVAASIGPSAIVNSLTCDSGTLQGALPPLARAGAGAVIMLKDRAGIPESTERILALAAVATAAAREAGMAPARVYLDPALPPIAAGGRPLAVTLEAIREISRRYPEWGRIAGLSNVSFGLPERRLVNRACAAMLVAAGVTALVCDTTDRELSRAIVASEALTGVDPMCRRYLAAFRSHRPRG